MDHITAIRAFLRVVDTGSFTKAAAHLDYPKSTVSKLVRDLEDHLGTKLIQRSTRSLTTTTEGSEYYKRVNRLVTKLDEADAALRGMAEAASGRLRVDMHSSMANFVVIPLLAEFRALHPGIQLVIGINDRPVNLIEEGVDCVIRFGYLSDSSLIARTVIHERVITCASPAYLERYGTPNTPTDLEKNHQKIGYFNASTGESMPMQFRNKGTRHLINNFDLSSNESTGIINLILAGLGVGQTQSMVARKYLESGELVQVLANWTNDSFPISIMFPPTKRLNARVRVFVDWVAGRLQEESIAADIGSEL